MGLFTKAERNLIKAFNDYDQTVDVVSCWHQFSETVLGADGFHRFPKFQPGDLTPDFAVTSHRLIEAGESRAGLGSFICDIKKFPHPYTDSANEDGDFRAYDRSVEQLRRYASELRLDVDQGTSIYYRRHDIILITKSELVDVVYKYLVGSNIQKPFHIGRPLVLVEYTYDAADQEERYVFRWKQGEHNSPFSHEILKKLMVDRAQPMKAPPHVFIPSKLEHVLCNDNPPIIYMLVFLWLEVFPELLGPEQYAAIQLDSAKNVLQLRCSPASVIEYLRTKYKIPVRTGVIRECLNTLARLKKAYRVSGSAEEFEVYYSSLSARPKPIEGQESIDKRNEGREYAVIFARMMAKLEEIKGGSLNKRRSPTPSGQYELF